METLRALNRKKVKSILNSLKELYGTNKLELDYIFFQNNKGRLFLLSNKFKEFEKNVKINSLGMYFANLKNNEIRLSIEGSQLIGRKAKKNILELKEKELKEWLSGEDLEIVEKFKGFVLIKNENDFYGTGKIVSGKLLNFVPKERRINAI